MNLTLYVLQGDAHRNPGNGEVGWGESRIILHCGAPGKLYSNGYIDLFGLGIEY